MQSMVDGREISRHFCAVYINESERFDGERRPAHRLRGLRGAARTGATGQTGAGATGETGKVVQAYPINADAGSKERHVA